MTDANTGQTVECPICETSFDPTVAGGWCTNTDCGEWQYTDDGSAEPGEGPAPDGEEAVSVPGHETTASDDSEPADTSAAAADSVDESGVDSVEDPADSVDESAVDSAEDPADSVDESAVDSAEDLADSVDESAVDSAGDPVGSEVESDAPDDEADTAVSDTDEADPEPPDADDEPAAGDRPVTVDCPDCGSTLDLDVNFCPDCGADVQNLDPAGPLTECPSCDSEVDPEDSFCANCGEDLDAHRDGGVDGSEAVEPSHDTDAEDAVDALESAAGTTVPDSLVLEISGREIDVDDGDTVGREIRAALIDAGRPEDEAVRIHREHVRFVREDDSFYLLDLGDNPTELNGQTLQKGDREPVAHGDEIELSGVATVTVRAP